MRVGRKASLGGALALVMLGSPLPALAAGTLNLVPDPVTLTTNFVVLLALIYPVNRLLLQPLVRVLAERDARTFGALERAEALASESAASRAALEEQLADARAESQRRRLAILSEAEAEESRLLGEARTQAAAEVDRVRDSVAAALGTAREALRAESHALAREAAGRILGREL